MRYGLLFLCRRASLLHQADEAGLDPSVVDEQMATLVMPHPDVTQCCSALLGQSQACLELMQVSEWALLCFSSLSLGCAQHFT